MEHGQNVWTKRIYGPAHGHRPGYGKYLEWFARPLVIRQAIKRYGCPDCQAIIEIGDLHGSTFYDHYCLNCVSETKPETRHERITIEQPKTASSRISYSDWMTLVLELTEHAKTGKSSRMAYRRSETPQEYAKTMSRYAQEERERVAA